MHCSRTVCVIFITLCVLLLSVHASFGVSSKAEQDEELNRLEENAHMIEETMQWLDAHPAYWVSVASAEEVDSESLLQSDSIDAPFRDTDSVSFLELHAGEPTHVPPIAKLTPYCHNIMKTWLHKCVFSPDDMPDALDITPECRRIYNINAKECMDSGVMTDDQTAKWGQGGGQ